MKNVLVIVYYFPPMGGSGVQRPLKFVKYLRDFGWNPIVLCPEPGAYHTFDNSLKAELDALNIEIHRVEGNTPLHYSGDVRIQLPTIVESLLRFVSTFFWLPDNKKGWIKTGFEKAREIIKSQNIDLVFATAPPYSNLILAKKIKDEFNIPVVMDLRDDWLGSHLLKLPTKWHYSKNKNLEKEILSEADQIITINEYIANALAQREINEKQVIVIPHGFDPSDFDKTVNIPKRRDKVSFLYSGTFYPESGPELFLQAIASLIKENPEFKEKIELQFQGHLTDSQKKLFTEYSLESITVDFGYVNHKKSVENLKKADVLWLNNEHKKNAQIISLGKTFEYMASLKPILGIIPNGDTRDILELYGSAYLSMPDDLVVLKENISSVLDEIERDSIRIPDKAFVNSFSRRTLTQKLASIFNVISP